MSRRNRIPRRESALPGDTTIRVVCTDGGQHPRVSFGKIVAWPSEAGGWRTQLFLSTPDEEYVDLAPYAPENDLQPTPDRIHRTFRLRCRRCTRDVQLREEAVERIGAEFGAAGMDTFDISSLT